jgi:hypothetical protein
VKRSLGAVSTLFRGFKQQKLGSPPSRLFGGVDQNHKRDLYIQEPNPNNQPINQSTNQPINQSTNQLTSPFE